MRNLIHKADFLSENRCAFWLASTPWLISQALSVTSRWLENAVCIWSRELQATAESLPAHSRRRQIARGLPVSKGLAQSARVRPSGRTSAKVEAALHESFMVRRNL